MTCALSTLVKLPGLQDRRAKTPNGWVQSRPHLRAKMSAASHVETVYVIRCNHISKAFDPRSLRESTHSLLEAKPGMPLPLFPHAGPVETEKMERLFVKYSCQSGISRAMVSSPHFPQATVLHKGCNCFETCLSDVDQSM